VNLKGWNIFAHSTPQDVADAVATGATLLRFQMVPEPGLAQNAPLNQWAGLLNQYFAAIDSFLPLLGNAQMLLDLHQPPGGWHGKRCLKEEAYRGALVWVWQQIAERYKDAPGIIGYGLMNEPDCTGAECKRLMLQLFNVVRSIDKRKIISVTCPWSRPQDMDKCIDLGTTGIWYEVHFYEPQTLTHQGLGDRKTPQVYPSRKFDRSELVKKLHLCWRLKQKNKQVFVGEFSIDTFADPQSRLMYLRDCVSAFNTYNFHWCFHCWREGDSKLWDGESGAVGEFLKQEMKRG